MLLSEVGMAQLWLSFVILVDQLLVDEEARKRSNFILGKEDFQNTIGEDFSKQFLVPL